MDINIALGNVPMSCLNGVLSCATSSVLWETRYIAFIFSIFRRFETHEELLDYLSPQL